MPPVHEFLQAIEARLRCPAERRPAVIEELRGHLADRAEALLAQGMSEADAERQATREMGAVWLLALRLSAANGWNVTAHILRELWAGVLALEMTLACVIAFATSEPVITNARFWLRELGPGKWCHLAAAYPVLLAALCAFGFSMGRTVRGWMWAIPSAIVLVLVGSAAGVAGLFGIALALLSGGLLFSLASAVGRRRQSPRMAWLAWASAGLTAVWLLGLAPVADFAHGTEWQVAFGGPDAAFVWCGTLALSWLFWLGAWVIERVDRAPGARVAE